MNKKLKTLLITIIILFILLFGICFEINYLLNKNNYKKQEKETPIYLQEETIETSILNLNNMILDNGLTTSISNDSYTLKNNVYHYTIFEDINLYIKPLEYIGNPKEEITYDLGIYYPKDSKYEGNAKIYLKHLIKVNNDLSDEEIEQLINKAVEASKENKDVTKNTGISIRYFDASENNNYKEFVIRRYYKNK